MGSSATTFDSLAPGLAGGAGGGSGRTEHRSQARSDRHGPPPPMSSPPTSTPPSGHDRVAGIDLGKVRVGLAISDELGLLAHERGALDGANRKRLLVELRALADREGVGHFVVGQPLLLTGEPGTAAQRAARFAQQLADATGRTVELVDERLTSVQAGRQLRESGTSKARSRERVDGRAAALILQQWLDGRRQGRADAGDD